MKQQTTINELKALSQWVCYTSNKIPKSPHNGKNASSIDPSTWADAPTAWKAKNRFGYAGIGFVFTIKSGIVGVDLDNCFMQVERDGKQVTIIRPWASDVVQCLSSYTELSPSGHGLHILVSGKIPHSIQHKFDTAPGEKSQAIEIYNEARYFTVTGKDFYGPDTIELRQDELSALFVTFGGDLNDPTPLPRVERKADENTPERVRELLSHMPVHQAYDDWLKCLMAVHDEYPDETGVQLIEAWSPGKRGEVRRKFRSFDRTAKNGVSIATLYHMAKDNGWKPPQRRVTYHNRPPERSTL